MYAQKEARKEELWPFFYPIFKHKTFVECWVAHSEPRNGTLVKGPSITKVDHCDICVQAIIQILLDFEEHKITQPTYMV